MHFLILSGSKKLYHGAEPARGEQFSSSSRALLHVQTAAPRVGAKPADAYRNVPLPQRHPGLGNLGGFGAFLFFFFLDVQTVPSRLLLL